MRVSFCGAPGADVADTADAGTFVFQMWPPSMSLHVT